MNARMFVRIGALAVAALLLMPVSLAKAETVVEIEISDFAFSPAKIHIEPGTTVRWTNRDAAPHTVTQKVQVFDSGFIFQGDTWEHTFEKDGTYEYFCKPHPFMTATIVVGEGGKVEPSPKPTTKPKPSTPTDSTSSSNDNVIYVFGIPLSWVVTGIVSIFTLWLTYVYWKLFFPTDPFDKKKK